MGNTEVPSNVQSKLDERAKVYGEADVVTSGLMLRLIITDAYAVDRLIRYSVFHYWYQIFTKLIRLTASPSHMDSWDDIIGYAVLAKERLNE